MDEDAIFAMYFSGIAAFQFHPANPALSRMSLEECADVADRMVELHRLRYPPKEV